MPIEFNRYLRRLRDEEYATDDALAEAAGVGREAINKQLNAGAKATLSVQHCLTLAKNRHESPSKILRLAGKGDVADLIEELYGKSRRSDLKPWERELIEFFEKYVPAHVRERLYGFLKDLWLQTEEQPAAPSARRGAAVRRARRSPRR